MRHSKGGCVRVIGGALVLAGAVVTVAPAPVGAATGTWTRQPLVQAPAPVQGDRFGTKVAISQDGSTVVVGAPATAAGAGAADVYVKNGDAWVFQAALDPGDPVAGDHLGAALAISHDGSAVAVGAPYKTVLGRKAVGAFYVFNRTGSTWAQTAELSPPWPSAQIHFGSSLSISSVGTQVAVGAPGRDFGEHQRAGQAYMYQRVKKVWQRTATVLPPDPIDDGNFGQSVIVKESLLLVAEPNDPSGGVVDIFDRSSGSYVLTTSFVPPDLQPGDGFGSAMALTLATVVVGAPEHVTATGGQGAAYRFTHNDTTGVWTYRNEFTAANGAPGDEFGTSVSLAGGTLAIGAPGRDPGPAFATGAVYPYNLSGAAWTPTAEIDAPHDPGARHTGFGTSVGASGSTIVAGEPGHRVGAATAAGVADVFAAV